MFAGHLISHFGDMPWPPHSPNLSTCDFYLWGYLKSRGYTHKLCISNDLKEAIHQEIRPIDRQLLARVMDDFKKRLENFIQEDSRHLTDIIFKI
jgi:SpoVK/Ycf46/Vps4 family AAA+-type ATPase